MDKDINILVVDDFSTMRRIVRNLLTDLGFNRVTEAGDAASAQATLAAGHFDLLIADGNLPRTAGKDLFAAVRAEPKLAGLRVLVITADAKRDQISAATAAGIDAWVVKPFTAAMLSEQLQRLFWRCAG